MQDWRGNAASIFATHGASNHSVEDRAEHDYYATDPEAVRKLLEVEEFDFYVLEPCCGDGHISKVLEANNYDVESWDLVKRSYDHQAGVRDFLQWNPEVKNYRDVVTNPPYNKAMEFVTHALDISTDGVRVAMFLKLTFLEGVKRKDLFSKYPPVKIYVFRNRVDCWKNGVRPKTPSRAVCYAWFIWEKGFHGTPTVGWID